MYALNLTHSPEKNQVWVTADHIAMCAGPVCFRGSMDSGAQAPGVADSIEQNNDSEAIPACGEFLAHLHAEYERPTARRRSDGILVSGRGPV